MCVIIHGLKKKHVKRDELVQAMKNNNSGFFIAGLHPDGTRSSLRTLVEKDVLTFFDSEVKDDDQVVMHARIPSYGPKSLDNVHGWEECNILFAHNMSLRSIDGFRDQFPDWRQKTDSEFFFRKMFIPYYKSLGADAYKDGKFHDDLDRYVKWICGSSNKFMFVMPDNKVLRYGDWVFESDRKEGDLVAMWGSNASYRLPKPEPRHAASTSSYGGYGGYGGYYGGSNTFQYPKRGRNGFTLGNAILSKFKGNVVAKRLSVAAVLQLACIEWVFANVASTRLIGMSSKEVADRLRGVHWGSMPFWITDEGIDTTRDLLPTLVDGDNIDAYVACYAPILEAAICTEGGRYPNTSATEYSYDTSAKKLKGDIELYKRLLNVEFRFDQKNPRNMAVAYDLELSRKGTPVMRRVDALDVFGHDDMSAEDTFKAFGNILAVINDPDKKDSFIDLSATFDEDVRDETPTPTWEQYEAEAMCAGD